VLRQLLKDGMLSEEDLETPLGLGRIPGVLRPGRPAGNFLFPPGQARLSKGDCAYLLSLLLLAEGLGAPFAAPPDLFGRLAGALDERLRGSAARKASQALAEFYPQSPWVFEEEPPPTPAPILIDILQAAIHAEQAVDVLYQAAGRPTPEYRHLTPLLLEQRGGRYYLIAYCHIRRGQRTFRLDRLQLVDFPPRV
jgi:hypothetical protein